MSTYLRTIREWILAHKVYAALGLAILIGLALALFSGSPAEEAGTERVRSVRVARVSELMTSATNLAVVGTVQSTSEAKISTETGGRIVRVNAALGSTVGAGSIIAEIENASQRASLLQAEGALDAARASQGGALGSAVTTILNAYAAIDSAVEDAVGQIFSDPEMSAGSFTVSSKDTQALSEIARMRPELEPILERHADVSTWISDNSDIGSELEELERELRDVRAYLDIVLKALNAGVPRDDITTATISGYITDVTAARASVTTSLSAVAAARASAAQNGAITSSQASIKQAEGAYNAALAALEKTRIRAPIYGTLNNFTLKLGDSVAPGQQVAIVSNNGSLEVVSSISQDDRERIVVGQRAEIEGGFTGTVTRIAPALDPITRKIEVRIGLPVEARGALVNGESVRVAFTENSVSEITKGPLRIPITALKMEPDRTVVFSVNGESKLIAIPITTGDLSGSFIEVAEGLTLESEIVADARGLKEGDTVKPAAGSQ